MCCNCGTIVDDHPGVQWALELSERAPEMADLISDPRPAVRAVWDQLRKEQQ